MPDKIKLVSNDDGVFANSGTFSEPGTDVTWIRSEYTEPRESLFDCCVCDKPIEDWYMYTCMDGGEDAHIDCVEVVSESQ